MEKRTLKIWLPVMGKCGGGRVCVIRIIGKLNFQTPNRTFVNGIRLSAEGVESVAHELKSGDLLEFGVDILNEDNVTVLYKKVACRITMVNVSVFTFSVPLVFFTQNDF